MMGCPTWMPKVSRPARLRRYKAAASHPGNWWLYEVFLDGVKLECCIEADSENGVAKTRDRVGGEVTAHEGHVEILLRPDYNPTAAEEAPLVSSRVDRGERTEDNPAITTPLTTPSVTTQNAFSFDE